MLQQGLQVWGGEVPDSLIAAPFQQGMEGDGFLRSPVTSRLVAGVPQSQEL